MTILQVKGPSYETTLFRLTQPDIKIVEGTLQIYDNINLIAAFNDRSWYTVITIKAPNNDPL